MKKANYARFGMLLTFVCLVFLSANALSRHTSEVQTIYTKSNGASVVNDQAPKLDTFSLIQDQSEPALQTLNPAVPGLTDTPFLLTTAPGITLPAGVDPKLAKELEELHKETIDPKNQPKPEELEMVYFKVWQMVGSKFYDESKLVNWHLWADKYKGKLKTIADLDKALTEMVGSLNDRWTTYTSLESTVRNQVILKSGIVPLGIALAPLPDGNFRIEALLWNSNAWKINRFRPGDVVKSISLIPPPPEAKEAKNAKAASHATPAPATSPEIHNLSGMTKEAVNELLLAKTGTQADIVINHDGEDETVSVTFAPTEASTIEVSLLPDKIGYMHLPSFGNSEEEAKKLAQGFPQALFALHHNANGNLQGLILDLRGNTGGVVQLAQNIASLFLDTGTFIKTRAREGRNVVMQEQQFAPSNASDFYGMPKELATFVVAMQKIPLVVLVDGSSVSSSEILASTLRDNKRALVIGSQTFGKAVVFISLPLPTKGDLQITVLHYLTPGGEDISEKGLTPSVVVDQPRNSSIDKQLIVATQAIHQLKQQMSDPWAPAILQQGDGEDSDNSLLLWGIGLGLILLGLALTQYHHHLKGQKPKGPGNKKR